MKKDDGYRSTYEFGGSEEDDDFPWYVWIFLIICIGLIGAYQWVKKQFSVDVE